jgi:putative phosphoesterase
VVSDTHVGEYLPSLPPGVCEQLAGVDCIFHCGDIVDTAILRELEAIAPVQAVAGNHDPATSGLPRHKIVTLGGKRFGLVHGDGWGFGRNLPLAAFNLMLWRVLFFAPGYPAFLLGGFAKPVDVVVSGHLHRPLHLVRQGTTIFSPGAVYMPNRKLLRWAAQAGGRRRNWVRRAVAWLPIPMPPPAVGIIEIDDERVTFRRVNLPAFE